MARKMRVQTSTAMPIQFKMYLEEETLTALADAARRFKRRSAQQVAEEIIILFLPYWEQAEQTKMNRIEKTKEQLLATGGEIITSRKLRPYNGKGARKKRR